MKKKSPKRKKSLEIRDLFPRVSKVFLLAVFFSGFTLAVAAQSRQTVTVNVANVPVSDVFEAIKGQTGYTFMYNTAAVDAIGRVSVNMKDASLQQVLDRCLANSSYTYSVEENQVIIRPRETAQRQPVVVRGRVVDSAGQPLTGVTVILEGTTTGTTTDANGEYSVAVPAGGRLTFSFVGFEPQTIDVGTKGIIDVRLIETVQNIGEVIVTGYRLIDQESATGSYATVGADVLDKKPVTNIADALNGMVAGLATVASPVDGQDRFLLRGEGTLQFGLTDHDKRLDTDPLIVVDGFPVQGFTPTGLGGNGILNAKDPFATINPNDVESITVLKDAAATSIYGAHAANGVIVITTKKGRAGEKVNISVNGFISVSSKPDLDYAFNMASAENHFRYMENLKKYSPNYSAINPYASAANPFMPLSDGAMLMWEAFDAGNISEAEYNAGKAALIAQAQGGKWKDDLNRLVYRNAVTQQYNVALRGGTETHTYAFSAGFDKEDTHTRDVGNQRLMVNFMNSFKLHERLTLDVGLNGSMTRGENNGVDLATLKSGLSPWTRLTDENGNYNHMTTQVNFPYANGTNSVNALKQYTMYRQILDSKYAEVIPSSWYYNPVEDAKTMDNTSEAFNARLNVGLTYDILDGLSIAVRGQYERNQYEANMVYSPESFYVRHYNNMFSTLNASTGRYDTYFPAGSVLNDRGNKYEGYTFRAQADYKKQFGLHSVTAIAGTEVISSTNNLNPTIWRYGYNENTNAVLTSVDYVTRRANIFGSQVVLPFISPGVMATLEDRFFSVYLDTEYTYNNRYILTASLRADASNYLARDVRDKFSPFWSVGGGWILSREAFMQDVDWVNSLKLRTSIGESGLAAGKDGNATVTTVGVYPGNIYHTNNEPFNQIAARGNSTLTWEKTRTFDIGLEFRLWDDKLYGSVEYYNKYSHDVLSNATVPTIAQGVATTKFNNGAISNNGVELTLGTRMTIAGDLRWNGSINFSYNKNEIREYLLNNTSIRPQWYPGYSRNHIWVFNIAGYTDEGYMILQGKDGAQEIVKDRATSHYYDSLNPSAGEKVEDYNWSYALGSVLPSTYANFSSTFTWKGLTLSFLLTGKFGYYFARNDSFSVNHYGPSYPKTLDKAFEIYDQGYGNQSSYSAYPLYNDANAAVFGAGNTWYQLMTMVQNFSNANYLKGDHIRLNEIYLGYDLPATLLGNQKVFSGVNVFFQARNLGLIWSANKEMDPDYRIGTFKPMTTFTFGLKFNLN